MPGSRRPIGIGRVREVDVADRSVTNAIFARLVDPTEDSVPAEHSMRHPTSGWIETLVVSG
jgi:hypothetical protein